MTRGVVAVLGCSRCRFSTTSLTYPWNEASSLKIILRGDGETAGDAIGADLVRSTYNRSVFMLGLL